MENLINFENKTINIKALEFLTLQSLVGYANFESENDFLDVVDRIGGELFENDIENENPGSFCEDWNCDAVRDLQGLDLLAGIVGDSSMSYDSFVRDNDLLQSAIIRRIAELAGIKTEFCDEIEGTYVVKVSFAGEDYLVNCQTYMTHEYKESYRLSCVNESGGDIKDSGLREALAQSGIEESTKLSNFIESAIEDCAEKNMPANTAKAYFEAMDIYLTEDQRDNFGTFYPQDVFMHVYELKEDGYCIVYFEDVSEPNINNAIKGFRTFDSKEDWIAFREDVYSGEIDGSNVYVHYGDFTASKRAYDAIC